MLVMVLGVFIAAVDNQARNTYQARLATVNAVQRKPLSSPPYVGQITDSAQLATANATLRKGPPPPTYLGKLIPSPGESGPYAGSICYSIWSGPPLTTSTDAGINETFSLDGKKVDIPPSEQINLLLLVQAVDEQGKSVIRGGPIRTCYELRLATGVHLAALDILSWSGQIYSYQWAFEIR